MMKAFQNPVLGRVLGKVVGREPILRTGMGFWPARALHLAVEAGLFTELAGGPRSRDELMARFGWHPRATEPFLGALVAMGLLRRTVRQHPAFVALPRPQQTGLHRKA